MGEPLQYRPPSSVLGARYSRSSRAESADKQRDGNQIQEKTDTCEVDTRRPASRISMGRCRLVTGTETIDSFRAKWSFCAAQDMKDNPASLFPSHGSGQHR